MSEEVGSMKQLQTRKVPVDGREYRDPLFDYLLINMFVSNDQFANNPGLKA